MRPIDDSSSVSPVRSIDVDAVAPSPVLPIDPAVAIEKLVKCVLLKNLYSNIKMQMLA